MKNFFRRQKFTLPKAAIADLKMNYLQQKRERLGVPFLLVIKCGLINHYPFVIRFICCFNFKHVNSGNLCFKSNEVVAR